MMDEQSESVTDIGRALERLPGTIHAVVRRRGGVVPYHRCRRTSALSVIEREQISRRLAAGVSVRSIARELTRAASTISREITRNGAPQREVAMKFGFPKTTKPARVVMEVEDLSVVAGDRILFEHGSFVLERGRRMAVIGPNGAGKTMLVETLIGERQAASGTIKLGHNVQVVFFSQHADDLPRNATVLEAMSNGSPLGTTDCRTLLGRFLFSGAEVEKKVEVLSGGERRRLLLAKMVATGANVLVLDEPTNHLDVEAREALEDALDAFDGTILLVSHDRALIDAVADETLSVEQGTLVRRDGDYNDFVAATAGGVHTKTIKKSTPSLSKQKSAPKVTPEQRRVREIEAEISAKEDTIAALETELADASVRADHQLFILTAKAHSQRQEELKALMRQWEAAETAALNTVSG